MLDDAPKPPAPLPGFAGFYFRAFQALRNDRSYVTGFRIVGGPHGVPMVLSELTEMPIAFEVIDRYAARYGIVGEAFERLHRMIGALDDEYRAVLAERRAGNITQENEDGED